MRRKTFPKLKRGSTTWINVEHARKSDLEKIAKDFKLEPDHAHLILTTSSRSRFFESSKYVLLSVVHPILNEATGTIKGREVDIILTKTKICTIHRGHLLPLSDLFDSVKSTKNHHAMSHPAAILAEVLHTLAIDSYHILDHVSEHIDRIEKRILSNDKKLVPAFVKVQTNLIDIQKQFENQVFLLDRLYRSFSIATQRKVKKHFEELEKHHQEIRTIINTELKTANTLHSAHETHLNEKTNSLIRALTLLSLMILPATLIAGIFGMNTKDTWIAGSSNDFVIILGTMLLSALIVLVLVSRKRW